MEAKNTPRGGFADGKSAITSRRLLWLPTTHLEYSSWNTELENVIKSMGKRKSQT
jgi:hypothetical protein